MSKRTFYKSSNARQLFGFLDGDERSGGPRQWMGYYHIYVLTNCFLGNREDFRFRDVASGENQFYYRLRYNDGTNAGPFSDTLPVVIEL